MNNFNSRDFDKGSKGIWPREIGFFAIITIDTIEISLY